MRYKTKKLGKYYWITGDGEYGPYGPYVTKKEADADRIGLNKTERNKNDHEYFCSDEVL